MNPPGSTARVHQHLDIGQGEVDWDEFFGTLGRMKFDGIMTVCVFAWEERARDRAGTCAKPSRSASNPGPSAPYRYFADGMHIPLLERRDYAYESGCGRCGSG